MWISDSPSSGPTTVTISERQMPELQKNTGKKHEAAWKLIWMFAEITQSSGFLLIEGSSCRSDTVIFNSKLKFPFPNVSCEDLLPQFKLKICRWAATLCSVLESPLIIVTHETKRQRWKETLQTRPLALAKPKNRLETCRSVASPTDRW